MMGGDCCCGVPACCGPCAGRRCVDPSIVVGGLEETSTLVTFLVGWLLVLLGSVGK